ncbi:hypothetical protein [Cellulomonas sp. IC4_254]|uniref:hypothetical protein n=1 Tax=Cellulomonas sp. IC4_254 TaxID=2714040 RepID=UPI00141FF0BA|nr:hypothetical protein [Cellulomonas sp. IC4_254]NHT17305.1 hypothetical protein [Cellulomonas sp. IC4_254]
MLNRLALVPGSVPERAAFFWEPTVDGVPAALPATVALRERQPAGRRTWRHWWRRD